jgi:cytochrome c oxidase subunit I+III
LISTLILGISFLAIKGYEWYELALDGFTISSGLPAATFYITTGVHGAHVIAGLIGISYLIVKSVKGGFNSERYVAVENIGLYWHLVDIVWVFLFPLFYLI